MFFFSISFFMFWNSINLAYVSQLGVEYLIFDYLFTSQRESHSVPDMDSFALPLLILSHLELSRIDLAKLISSILKKIVTFFVVLVDGFYFYMHHPIKAWVFEKITFELVYLCLFIQS